MQRPRTQDAEQMNLEKARFRFFSDALVLKTLSDQDSLRDLDSIRRSLGMKRRSGGKYYELFNGYKLTVATALYSLLDRLITHPSLLGLNDDQRLWEWWAFSRTRKEIPSRAAFSSPDSDLANVAVRFYDLLRRIKRADKWDSMLEVADQAHKVGETLWDFGNHCHISWFKKRGERLETREVLRRGAIERLDDYGQGSEAWSAYRFIWRRDDEFHGTLSEAVPEDLLELESHLDYPPLQLLNRRRSRVNWSKGRKAGVCIALDRLRPSNGPWPSKDSLLSDFLEANDQLKDFLAFEQKDQYPSMECGLRPALAISTQSLLTPIVSSPMVEAEDRLRALLGGDTTRLVASGPVDALDFRFFMRGIVPDLDDDTTIEVVRVRHPDSGRSWLTWFSLAVRTPKFGLFSNFSKWWVFYKAYGIGWSHITDSEVRAAELVVEETLTEFADKIKLTELEGISSRAFLSLFEPPAWTFVFNGVKDLVDKNSELTGVLPELLATALLAKRGYSNIRTSYKPAMLEEERELDALGIKTNSNGGDCLVIETKGKSTTDRDLAEEVTYFASKVNTLKENLPALAKEIGYGGDLNTISGIFVSMARLAEFEPGEPDITFWDFNDFVAALRAEHIPGRFLDLLEPSRILFEWSPGHFPDRSWVDSNEWDEVVSEGWDEPSVEN